MRSLPAIRPRYGRHLGEAGDDDDGGIDLVGTARNISDSVEAFSVESILKVAVIGSVTVLVAALVIPMVPGGAAKALDGSLSLGGQVVRAVTTRPIGFVRRLSRDIRGL